MAKIFATKALSLVLCFVMLFMGAPVTTWATVDPYIAVEGDEWLNSPDRMEVKLTAKGFTDTDSVKWSADSTNVSFSTDTGATTTLSYTTLVGTNTDVTVTAQNDAGTESATTVIKLYVPGLYWTDEDGNILTGFDPNNPYMLPVDSTLSVAGAGRNDPYFEAAVPSVYGDGSAGLDACVSWNEDKTVVSATADSGETIFKLRASFGDAASATFDFYFKVYQPVVDSVEIVKDAYEMATENISGSALTLKRTEPGSYKFDAVVKDQHGREMDGKSVTWSVADDVGAPCGATVTDSEFAFTKAGKAKITATSTDNTDKLKLVAVTVESGIDHVSIVQPDSLSVVPGETVSLFAKAFADAAEKTELTDLGSNPFAWLITEGSSYASVDTSGKVTFNAGSAGQTVKVKATSTFDQSKSSPEVTFTVAAAEPDAPDAAFTPTVKEVTPYEGTGQLGAVKVGDEITYEISYKNYTSEAAEVTITSTLDDYVEFVRASDGWTLSTSAVTWTLSSVAAGAAGTVRLTVRVLEDALASGGVTALAAVQVGTGAVARTGDVVNLVPEAPTITAGSAGAVAVGDEITYTISYKNYKSEAAKVTIPSKLDENVELVDASGGGSENAGTVTWILEGVAADTAGTVTLKVKVLEGALASKNGPGKVLASATVQVGNDKEFETEPDDVSIKERGK